VRQAYANRPHAGVPEIGRFAYACFTCIDLGALPVVLGQACASTNAPAWWASSKWQVASGKWQANESALQETPQTRANSIPVFLDGCTALCSSFFHPAPIHSSRGELGFVVYYRIQLRSINLEYCLTLRSLLRPLSYLPVS
jgi:hypothetical protein